MASKNRNYELCIMRISGLKKFSRHILWHYNTCITVGSLGCCLWVLLLSRRSYVFLMDLCEAGKMYISCRCSPGLWSLWPCCSQHYELLAVRVRVVMWKSVRLLACFSPLQASLLPLSLLLPPLISRHFL